MEAYRIERFGSVDGIVLRSTEDPRPGLKEILMRVRASSLNYRDLMVLKGGGRGPTKIGVVTSQTPWLGRAVSGALVETRHGHTTLQLQFSK
jgi:NADPH:quinone reductase-like Zn-dependent oxidoreductase